MNSGTGIGNRLTADSEALDNERIADDYEARQKKGIPCGTHTLWRKRPQDVTPGWAQGGPSG